MVEARISTPVPTQPPIQWVPDLPQGYSGRSVTLTNPPPSRAEFKKRRAIHLLYLWAGRSEVRIPAEARRFTFPERADRTWRLTKRVPGALLYLNAAGRKVNHTPTATAEDKSEWSYTST